MEHGGELQCDQTDNLVVPGGDENRISARGGKQDQAGLHILGAEHVAELTEEFLHRQPVF